MVMDVTLIQSIVEDGFFAAMAAIGFAALSHLPMRTYAICGVAAAVGHALRQLMMSPVLGNVNIILASSVAAFLIGIIAVWLAPKVCVPAEACLFPSLLPMIPGMYAYRTIEALIVCVGGSTSGGDMGCVYELVFNSMTCLLIILCMVIGSIIPIFIFKRVSFQATRWT